MFENPTFYHKYDEYSEMSKNASELKKIKHAYNVIGWVYIVLCGYSVFSTLPDLLGFSVQINPLADFLDGVVFKLLLFYYGYFACYKHNNLYALIAIIVQLATALVDAFLYGFSTFGAAYVNFGLMVLVIAMSASTIVANTKYLKLEQLPGFPYFNQRFEEQKMDSRQHEIKDEYTQIAERYAKTSTSDMGDFTASAPSNDLSSNETNMMDSL